MYLEQIASIADFKSPEQEMSAAAVNKGHNFTTELIRSFHSSRHFFPFVVCRKGRSWQAHTVHCQKDVTLHLKTSKGNI